MAKMDILKPGEKSKKPEHLSHVKKLEEEIQFYKDKYNEYKDDSNFHIFNEEQKFKELLNSHKWSRILNALLFISHSFLAYVHFHK